MLARRFLYLLLTVLALQLSWGVVTVDGGHETGRASQHFGHHSSKPDDGDRTSEAGDKSSKPASKALTHSHCASCAHATLSFDVPSIVASLPRSQRVSPLFVSSRYASYLSARPERPQWIFAA